MDREWFFEERLNGNLWKLKLFWEHIYFRRAWIEIGIQVSFSLSYLWQPYYDVISWVTKSQWWMCFSVQRLTWKTNKINNRRSENYGQPQDKFFDRKFDRITLNTSPNTNCRFTSLSVTEYIVNELLCSIYFSTKYSKTWTTFVVPTFLICKEPIHWQQTMVVIQCIFTVFLSESFFANAITVHLLLLFLHFCYSCGCFWLNKHSCRWSFWILIENCQFL